MMPDQFSGSAFVMFQIIGIVLLFGLVFGSYIISGGKMDVILHAAPHELMAIGGAGIAAFLISNSMTVIKGTGGAFGKIFGGPQVEGLRLSRSAQPVVFADQDDEVQGRHRPGNPH
jgi:hypothetical protein